MGLQRFDEQGGIGWPFLADFVIRDDLILCFLNLDQSPKLRRFRLLSFTNDFRRGLKQTHQLVRHVHIIVEHSSLCLSHYLLDERNHSLQFCA
jgi:hypothetical protein